MIAKLSPIVAARRTGAPQRRRRSRLLLRPHKRRPPAAPGPACLRARQLAVDQMRAVPLRPARRWLSRRMHSAAPQRFEQATGGDHSAPRPTRMCRRIPACFQRGPMASLGLVSWPCMAMATAPQGHYWPERGWGVIAAEPVARPHSDVDLARAGNWSGAGFVVAVRKISCFGEREASLLCALARAVASPLQRCHNASTYAMMLGLTIPGIRVWDGMRWSPRLPAGGFRRRM